MGEVDSELQAEHISVILRVRVDVDKKFRRWDLLRKFDGLGDGVVTRLDRTLDLHVCFLTTCRVAGFYEGNEEGSQAGSHERGNDSRFLAEVEILFQKFDEAKFDYYVCPSAFLDVSSHRAGERNER